MGSHRLRSRFVRFVVRRCGFDARRESLRIFVGHGGNTQEGRLLAQEIEQRFPAGSVEFCALTDMGPAIGVHGGPGTLIVALHRKPKATA
jgi:fatty acid-binding protein DegV